MRGFSYVALVVALSLSTLGAAQEDDLLLLQRKQIKMNSRGVADKSTVDLTAEDFSASETNLQRIRASIQAGGSVQFVASMVRLHLQELDETVQRSVSKTNHENAAAAELKTLSEKVRNMMEVSSGAQASEEDLLKAAEMAYGAAHDAWKVAQRVGDVQINEEYKAKAFHKEANRLLQVANRHSADSDSNASARVLALKAQLADLASVVGQKIEAVQQDELHQLPELMAALGPLQQAVEAIGEVGREKSEATAETVESAVTMAYKAGAVLLQTVPRKAVPKEILEGLAFVKRLHHDVKAAATV